MSDTSPTNGSMTTSEPDGSQAGFVGVYGGHLTGNGQSSWSGLVAARQRTHGPFKLTAACAQELKAVLRKYGSDRLQNEPREAMDMVCSKLARIACGGSLPEHWEDVGGYAELAMASCRK